MEKIIVVGAGLSGATVARLLAENGRDLENKHYAELLFQNQLDWDQVIANLTGMWGGEYAAWLMSVLY